jgi:hypothetical protein
MHRLNIPLSLFIDKLLAWGKQFSHFALFPGNEYPDAYHQYDLLFAAGANRSSNPKKKSLIHFMEVGKKNQVGSLGISATI